MLTKEGKIEPSNRVYALLVLVVVGVLLFWGFRMYEIWHTAEGIYPQQVTVDALGKAYVTPDIAEITLGVHTEGNDSATAVKNNSDKMNKVIAEIKALGIDPKDIQTTSYYMNPNTVYDQVQGSVTKGYSIDQTIVVKVRDLTKAGSVVAKATESGANTLGGIQFKVDDPEKAKTVARAEAIKKAEEKAKSIEQQTGLKFSEVIGYYEYSNDSMDYGKGGPVYSNAGDMGGGGVTPPDTQAGQQEVTLTVSLTYRVD